MLEKLEDQYRERIDRTIRNTATRVSPNGSPLLEMLSYHLETGGKRLRALIPLALADALGSEPDQVLNFGAACELLHNATLVHDDLQDGDKVRRHSPTVWAEYTRQRAIDLGNAGYFWTLDLVDSLAIPPHRKYRLVQTVASTAIQIIDGQDREFTVASVPPTRQNYSTIAKNKTGALFSLAFGGTGMAVGASEQTVRGLNRAGTEFGIAFQIQDDLLDLYRSQTKGHNRRGADLREGTWSLPVICAVEEADSETTNALIELINADEAQTSTSDIEWAIEVFDKLEISDKVRNTLIDHVDAGRNAIRKLEHPQLTATTESILEGMFEPTEL